MKRFIKILICLILAAVIPFGVMPAFAAGEQGRLLSVYSDNMLFKQNEPVELRGFAAANSKIEAKLYNSHGLEITGGASVSAGDGAFCVSFTAPKGSFENYTIKLFCNSGEFLSLKDVVFGELWIAGGQSNMQYPVIESASYKESFENHGANDQWLRVLHVPAYPEYQGSEEKYPYNPQQEIKGALWLKGTEPGCAGMSAVAWFFARELINKLNMPVGYLNANLGGSSIVSWLSRETIDSDNLLSSYLRGSEKYFDAQNWDENNQSPYYDMTVNYNKKIYPLRHFRLSGMIWYQGETDFIFNFPEEVYVRALELLQSSYKELFSSPAQLPFIATQIAPYEYTRDHEMQQWNNAYISFAQGDLSSRAAITIHDVPLDFIESAGAIHPSHKQEVGERMAKSAAALVYGIGGEATAASFESMSVSGREVTVKLKNTYKGLAFKGEKLLGFSLCGEDGVFYAADAEITGTDEIKVTSKRLKNPVAVAYGYCENNHYANLYSKDENDLFMPVSAFISEPSLLTLYCADNTWMPCDKETSWHLNGDRSGEFPTWSAKSASLSFERESSAAGTGTGLRVIKEKSFLPYFSVNPVFSQNNSLKKRMFSDLNNDWSHYGALAFKIRNNSQSPLKIECVKIYKYSSYFTPALFHGSSKSYVIPADGQWHEVVVNLNRLYFLGNDCSAYFSNESISGVTGMKLEFSSKQADLSLDSFEFIPEEGQGSKKITFSADYKNIKGPFGAIAWCITRIIGLFVR